ncbi:hypothetical protein [Streptodolium elevatio]
MTLSRVDGRPGDKVTLTYEASCGRVHWDGKPVPAKEFPGGEFCKSYEFTVPADAAARDHKVGLGDGSPVVDFTVWPNPRIEVDRTAQPGQRAFIHYLNHESCAASITFDDSTVLGKVQWGYQSGDFVIPAGADPKSAHSLRMPCGGKVAASAPMTVQAPSVPPLARNEPTQPPPPPPVVGEPGPADPVPVAPGVPQPQVADPGAPAPNAPPELAPVPVPPSSPPARSCHNAPAWSPRSPRPPYCSPASNPAAG